MAWHGVANKIGLCGCDSYHITSHHHRRVETWREGLGVGGDGRPPDVDVRSVDVADVYDSLIPFFGLIRDPGTGEKK